MGMWNGTKSTSNRIVVVTAAWRFRVLTYNPPQGVIHALLSFLRDVIARSRAEGTALLLSLGQTTNTLHCDLHGTRDTSRCVIVTCDADKWSKL